MEPEARPPAETVVVERDGPFIYRLRVFTYTVTSVAAILFILLVLSFADAARDLARIGDSPTLPSTALGPPPALSPVPDPAVGPPAEPPPAGTSTGEDVIRFEVTGTGTGSVTYVADENFSQQQENGVALPWAAEITLPNGLLDYQPLSMTAQSTSGDPGEIVCRILRNGALVTESTSSGAYAVVTCSG